jgi:predicted  nucleic acid-binding Zn-ribbon protein
MSEYLNRYVCYECGHTWHDVWDCGVEDDCPRCGARHVEPMESNELDPLAGLQEVEL